METFFEGCRLLVEKEFSLQGFLLKPVQVGKGVSFSLSYSAAERGCFRNKGLVP
eukprot:m.67545 g.67545  ORF g.67545 m.67545 type:complete len:54 (+) comp13834_c1_seq4:1442-1603(+)